MNQEMRTQLARRTSGRPRNVTANGRLRNQGSLVVSDGDFRGATIHVADLSDGLR